MFDVRVKLPVLVIRLLLKCAVNPLQPHESVREGGLVNSGKQCTNTSVGMVTSGNWIAMQGSTILHIIDTTGPGGAETIFTQLCAETNRRGFHALALIRGEGWVATELRRLNVETIVLDCKGSFNVRFLFALVKIIRSRKVTLIQSHLLGSNVYASLAGLLTSRPVYSTFHGFVDVGKNERFHTLKFLSIRFGSKAIFSVTEALADMLVKSAPVNPSRVFVISNGVDTEKFSCGKGYEIPLDRKIKIGCLGNVRSAKNYPLAISLLKQLIDDEHNVELHIAGDDKNKLGQACREQAIELGVDASLIWRGFIEDAPAYLHELDLFLLCSSSEGHPLALTQAMSCGLPIVTTACGVEKVVTHNETAIIVDNENLVALVNGVKQALGNAEIREFLGQGAAKVAREKWSLTFTLDKYFKCYGVNND